MEEFKKNKKRHVLINAIMGVLIVICLISGISLEILAEIDNTIALILFVIAFGLLVIGILCFILFYKMDRKITQKLLEQLNQEIDREYTYTHDIPIIDLIQDSLYQIPNKTTSAFAKEGISGKLEDVSFEYYLFTFEKESFFTNQKDAYELYIYKNSSVFSREFFVTKEQMKKVEDYKETSIGYTYIYTKHNEEFSKADLPGDVFFLSVNQHTLFVFKKALRKQPLYMQAETLEEFKDGFAKEIEKIKLTYEETKNWTK
ncbi:MAG: hypothetical protein K2N65_03225 [Anaeroplasmataceae bacterium]|nr:hypothetical protein [Anaeroplasmataceae bacterium]